MHAPWGLNNQSLASLPQSHLCYFLHDMFPAGTKCGIVLLDTKNLIQPKFSSNKLLNAELFLKNTLAAIPTGMQQQLSREMYHSLQTGWCWFAPFLHTICFWTTCILSLIWAQNISGTVDRTTLGRGSFSVGVLCLSISTSATVVDAASCSSGMWASGACRMGALSQRRSKVGVYPHSCYALSSSASLLSAANCHAGWLHLSTSSTTLYQAVYHSSWSLIALLTRKFLLHRKKKI